MRTKSIIAALILAVALSAPASAVVLGLDWGHGTSPVTIVHNGSSRTVYAGSLEGYFGGSIGNPLPPTDGTYFGDVFCVDLAHSITIPTEYEVETLSTAVLTNGGRAAWLYKNHVADAKSDAETAAALQIAIWDVVVDGGDGLDVGNFRYVSGLSSKSNGETTTMLAESAGHSDQGIYLRAIGPYGQSMLMNVVPEPGTFGLLGLGLGLVGLGIFRKRD